MANPRWWVVQTTQITRIQKKATHIVLQTMRHLNTPFNSWTSKGMCPYCRNKLTNWSNLSRNLSKLTLERFSIDHAFDEQFHQRDFESWRTIALCGFLCGLLTFAVTSWDLIVWQGASSAGFSLGPQWLTPPKHSFPFLQKKAKENSLRIVYHCLSMSSPSLFISILQGLNTWCQADIARAKCPLRVAGPFSSCRSLGTSQAL